MLSGVSTGINTLPAMPVRQTSDFDVQKVSAFEGKMKKANP